MDLDTAFVDAVSKLQSTCTPDSALWRGYDGLKADFKAAPTYARKREMLKVLYRVLTETEERAAFESFSGKQKPVA